jgi:hypothetical protein
MRVCCVESLEYSLHEIANEKPFGEQTLPSPSTFETASALLKLRIRSTFVIVFRALYIVSKRHIVMWIFLRVKISFPRTLAVGSHLQYPCV